VVRAQRIHAEVSADLACEILANVVVARHGGALVQAGIRPPRVSGSLPQPLTSVGSDRYGHDILDLFGE
jgi:hypothetical protein